MSRRKPYLLTSLASFLLGIVLIGAINVLQITEGLPLLIFVIMIGVSFLVSLTTFIEGLRKRPDSKNILDSIFDAIFRSI